jgi:hypothetical protein
MAYATLRYQAVTVFHLLPFAFWYSIKESALDLSIQGVSQWIYWSIKLKNGSVKLGFLSYHLKE